MEFFGHLTVAQVIQGQRPPLLNISNLEIGLIRE